MSKVQVNNMITPSPAPNKMTHTVVFYQMNTTTGNLVPGFFHRREDGTRLYHCIPPDTTIRQRSSSYRSGHFKASLGAKFF